MTFGTDVFEYTHWFER